MTAPMDLGHRAAVPLAPGAWPVIGHAWPLLRNPLGFLASLPAHGGLVQVRLSGLAAVVVCDPGLTREVLLDDRTYDKGGPIYDGLREWVGDGIASSPHRTHRRQRRLIQPAFHPGRIPGYAETMAARIAAATGRWHEGQVIDVVPELLAQTTVETMFSGVLTPQALREAVEDFTTVVVGIFWRMLQPPLLRRLPTPGNQRYHRARSRLRRTVDAVLRDRRAEPRGTDHGDLLSALLAGDPADGGLSDTEVSDQILTFLAAGAETTASAVSWALHLLSVHPGLRDRVYAEVGTVLAGAPVGPQHLPRLELTGRVVTEAVRLYPPGWLLTRTVTADTTLGGHALPAGTTDSLEPQCPRSGSLYGHRTGTRCAALHRLLSGDQCPHRLRIRRRGMQLLATPAPAGSHPHQPARWLLSPLRAHSRNSRESRSRRRAAAGERQRELVSWLRAVADAEYAVLRQELDAERELRRRLELRIAELERQIGMESPESGTPSSKERIGAKGARRQEPERERAERPQPERAARAPGHDGASVVTCPGSHDATRCPDAPTARRRTEAAAGPARVAGPHDPGLMAGGHATCTLVTMPSTCRASATMPRTT